MAFSIIIRGAVIEKSDRLTAEYESKRHGHPDSVYPVPRSRITSALPPPNGKEDATNSNRQRNPAGQAGTYIEVSKIQHEKHAKSMPAESTEESPITKRMLLEPKELPQPIAPPPRSDDKQQNLKQDKYHGRLLKTNWIILRRHSGNTSVTPLPASRD
jgi:hypothetical protein